MRTSSSGMSAERTRIDVIARNLANAEVTRTPEGGPYRREVVRFAQIMAKEAGKSVPTGGVRVASIDKDMKTPFERIRIPGHPDADDAGWVTMPNINTTLEMADLMTAVRAYEANANAADNFVRMAERALRLAQ
ncbi:MAG: flagellar basal body rod protein FlgC [Planctomycetes bacterium]|nr:flagellar basal body rod protein FlgC [Planctomycetota bacterium]